MCCIGQIIAVPFPLSCWSINSHCVRSQRELRTWVRIDKATFYLFDKAHYIVEFVKYKDFHTLFGMGSFKWPHSVVLCGH